MNGMHQLNYGRTLMGDSLGFHIIFALLGVGIPLLVSLVELTSIIKNDRTFYLTAKRWSFVMALLFVVGGISGMIISFQLSALWPTFMALAGKVIGIPFYMETFAFFIEAIFLGIYLYTWKRYSRIGHWLCSLPIVVGSAASAFFITTANAFMNAPQGFTMLNGQPVNIHPFAAMFNPAVLSETTHSISAYYLTTFLFFAGIYGILYLRAENMELKKYYRKLIAFIMPFALLFGMLVAFTGDNSGKYLAQHEPLKLAAAEGDYSSQNGAPLRIGGSVGKEPLNGSILIGSIQIPKLLSILAYGSTNAFVVGLDHFDPSIWPPLWIHYMFDLMAGIGMLIVLVPLIFVVLYFWKPNWKFTFSKPMLIAIFISGVLAFFAVEFGWILTEVGRQPWAIKGIMLTEQAFTTSQSVRMFGFIFPTLYLALFIITPWILLRRLKKYPLEKELAETEVNGHA